MANVMEIVGGFKKAMGSGDVAAARGYLHDQLSFQGPFDKFDRPEPYLEALKRLHPVVKGVVVHKTFVDGQDVCMLYDLQTNSPAGDAFVAEWMHVEGDKIVSIRTVFDARPFAPMFSK
jgi:hypothetical protein